MNKYIYVVTLVIALIILNQIPYTYSESSSKETGNSEYDCRWDCAPDSFSIYKENMTYSRVEEVPVFEENILVKTNQTFNGTFVSVNCRCQTSLLKKSFSWILNNNRY